MGNKNKQIHLRIYPGWLIYTIRVIEYVNMSRKVDIGQEECWSHARWAEWESERPMLLMSTQVGLGENVQVQLVRPSLEV